VKSSLCNFECSEIRLPRASAGDRTCKVSGCNYHLIMTSTIARDTYYFLYSTPLSSQSLFEYSSYEEVIAYIFSEASLKQTLLFIAAAYHESILWQPRPSQTQRKRLRHPGASLVQISVFITSISNISHDPPQLNSQIRFLPQSIPLTIPLPIHLLPITPHNIICPKHLRENHAHFQIRQAFNPQSALSSPQSWFGIGLNWGSTYFLPKHPLGP